MNKRITPNKITQLKDNEIFVFGSNLSGIHGAGAAKTAMMWGAKLGMSIGLQGKTYAIPTKDASIRHTLPLSEIKMYVNYFIEFAKNNKNLVFLVTEIGCGLAGLKPKDVAPLFQDCKNIENIYLPENFWKYIN